MKEISVKLTAKDRQVLASIAQSMEGLAAYLGPAYEIVVHNLEKLDNSVIGIYNGHYSGRDLGAPITDIGLTMLGNIREHNAKCYANYFTKNKYGQNIKATTTAIRGEDGQIIGLICINMYLDTPLYEYVANMLPSDLHDTPVLARETLSNSAEELIDVTAKEAKNDVMNDLTIPASMKVRRVTEILYDKGIFELKNSVDRTATILGVSKNTVYMHLRYIKGERRKAKKNR